MSISLFSNKSELPTWDQIYSALGVQRALWESLTTQLRSTFPVQEEIKFMYGMKYGWALNVRVKQKLLVNLYPAKDSFIVQVNLPAPMVETASQLDLGENARKAFQRAYPYPEGRWLFILVESAQDLDDVLGLLALRVEHKDI